MERSVTVYIFEIGVQSMEQAADGRYDLVKKPITTVEATYMGKTEIRKALKEFGVDCPKGTDVYAEKVGAVKYTYDLDVIIANATSREVLDLRDDAYATVSD